MSKWKTNRIYLLVAIRPDVSPWTVKVVRSSDRLLHQGTTATEAARMTIDTGTILGHFTPPAT